MKITKITSMVIALVLVLGLCTVGAYAANDVWDGKVATSYAGGTGTQTDPYQIATGAQLAYMAQQVKGGNAYDGKYFVLTADIKLNDTNNWTKWSEDVDPKNTWTPIGYSHAEFSEEEYSFVYDNAPFEGNFDGQGHYVSGVYAIGYHNMGLFGIVEGATICNVGVRESYVFAGDDAGSVVGTAIASSITNCYNMGTCTGSLVYGGIAGKAENCNISKCYNTGKVLFAESHEYNTDVEGSDMAGICGGITGVVYEGTISDCYNTGLIRTVIDPGSGIAGIARDGCKISTCYNVGKVEGDDEGMGINGIASADDCTVENCYYLDTSVPEISDVGSPLTDSQMKNAANFAGFDFTNVWTMDGNGNYPYPELKGMAHAGENVSPTAAPTSEQGTSVPQTGGISLAIIAGICAMSGAGMLVIRKKH